MHEHPRYTRALELFEAAHREDPRSVEEGEGMIPWSVQYHRRLLRWTLHLDPSASEPLRLAAASQHIRRWSIPRGRFEEGRSGYKRWRSELARFHADQAASILSEAGYGEDTIERVGVLLRKVGLGRDPEVQRFEDAICLTFLEGEFDDFSSRHEDGKVIDIVRKTWAKMSESGRAAAGDLAGALPERARDLLRRALASPG